MWFLLFLALQIPSLASTAQAGASTSLDCSYFVSATQWFEWRATAYQRFSWRCQGQVDRPSRRLIRQVCAAIEKWTKRYWSDDPAMWDPCYQLWYSENGGQNTNDDHGKSFGGWGVTWGAVQEVSRRYGFKLPLNREAARRRVEHDLDYATSIALGEFSLRLSESDGNIERAILHYKLGRYANIRKAKVRRAAWRWIRKSWACVAEKVAEGSTRYCDCEKISQ